MPAGRPRLLTPDLVARAAELRRDGLGVEAIGERLGMAARTSLPRAMVAGVPARARRAPSVGAWAEVDELARRRRGRLDA